jgi:SNF2 family DNA or RNA helicase
VLYLNRLIPEAWSLRSDQIALSDTLSNVETLDWVMVRFPLTVDPAAQDAWNERLEDIRRAHERRENIEVLLPAAPDSQFNGTLREFQKVGLDFLLKTGGRALLADEMGLGKGVAAIAYIATAEDVFPVCIVAPLVTLKHWGREIERFLKVGQRVPNVKVIRVGKRETILPADIYLINYELLSKRVEDMYGLVRTVIFDEIQALRNTSTHRYRAALELIGNREVKHVLGLSGTPIHNNGAEIWPITNLIRPGLLGEYKEFVAQYCTFTYGKVSVREPPALYALLRQEFMLRRRIVEVLRELPPKIRVKEYVEADLEFYEREVAKILNQLDAKTAGAKTRFERKAYEQHALTQERKVAALSKIPHVIKWVQSCLESDQPIIVYFHHLDTLDSLKRYLSHWSPCIIVGGQRDTERDEEIQRFQRGGSKLMLAGIRAGSLGISLTASSIVVFAELDWTPAMHKQAEGRSHRMGQDRQVLAYYLIAEGTLDEKIAEILVDKAEEIGGVLGDKLEEENTPEALRAIDELRQLPAFKNSKYANINTTLLREE